MRRVALAVVFGTFFAAQAARANDLAASDEKAKDPITSESSVKDSASDPTPTPPLNLQAPKGSLAGVTVLRALHGGLAAAQIYDVYSTQKALRLGAVELNPLLQNTARNRAAFIGLKIAMTAGPIYEAERLWKRNHRVGAIALMAAANGMMLAVAAHNASVMNNAVTVVRK